MLFRSVARFEFPNQPLTATPAVGVNTFPSDFNYKNALIHGNWNGWNRLHFEGITNPELCNYIWGLSDVLSFDSDMAMPETGWLLSIANRYGRPVICTQWNAPDESDVQPTLDLFSRSQVFWYSAGDDIPEKMIRSFQFTRISTPRR